MNTLKDTLDDDQDPDYAAPVPENQTHQQAYEENARSKTKKKIIAIVEKEFSKEIDAKEKEILQTQDRLDVALTTLHILRYAIVTDFYNRKQCQASEVSESQQTRIHPAVKKLIGKSPRVKRTQFIDNAIPSTSTDPRFINPGIPSTSKTGSVSSGNEKNVNSENDSIVHNNKRPHPDCNEREPPKKVPRYVPPKSAIPEPTGPSRGHRNKTCRRIVVGNISKWIPHDWREDDKTSHKWTAYVRGPEGKPDIGDFVAKVKFFLDPSYKPNDVVEITSPPFQLSRRGWGEFPLRVQLHFKNALNKPIDIIHLLKLDRTFSGLQTLGAETVCDLWIQINEPLSIPELVPDSSKSKNSEVESRTERKSSEGKLIPKPDNHSNLNNMHETSREKSFDPEFITFLDHDYCHSSLKTLVIENNRTIAHLSNGSIEPVLRNGANGENNISNGLTDNSVLGLNDNNINMQKFATTLKDTPGKLQPLQISIPQAFESSNKKQFLVLKNKDVVPMNFDPKSKNLLNSLAIQKKVNDISNKKDVVISDEKVYKPSEKSKLLKINPTNSILLTANYTEPALKIADLKNLQNHNEDMVLKNLVMRDDSNSFKSKMELKDKSKVGETKVSLKKFEENVMSREEIYEGVMRSIDDVRLSDTLSLVKFIINRIPLISEEACDPEFKRLHPFTCRSRDEFLSYPIGKQRGLEWQRAKAVRTLLEKRVSGEELWSMKEIIVWARRHAYTPISSISYSRKSSTKKTDTTPSSVESISSTCTEPVDLNKWLSESSRNIRKDQDSDSDVEIDILSENERNENQRLNDVKGSEDVVMLNVPPESESLFALVNESSRQIGIRITDCAASVVITQAIKCFVENLVRLSHAKAIDRSENQKSDVETINLEDVRGALLKREEFDLFTNAGLGTQATGDE